MSPNYFAAGCLSVMCMAMSPAQAAMSPARHGAAPVALNAAARCSYGTHLDPSGFCVDSMDYSRSCPATYFPLSFPSGNGYRCVPAEWMASGVWLGDFLRPWGNGLPR